MKLFQKYKIHELIRKFDLENFKPTDTPMDLGYIKVNYNDSLLSDNTKYRQAVGALLYKAIVTRRHISVAVNLLSQRNENPRLKDWESVKIVIRYLKTTNKYKLVFSSSQNPVLRVYADANWTNNPVHRKSTTGHLFMLVNNPICWFSRRKPAIALSL